MALKKYIILQSDIDPETSTFDCPDNAYPVGLTADISNVMYVTYVMTLEEYKKQVAADPEFAKSFIPKQPNQNPVSGQKI